MDTSPKARFVSTVRAFELIRQIDMNFDLVVSSRARYMKALEDAKSLTRDPEALELLDSALSDVTSPETIRFALLASERI